MIEKSTTLAARFWVKVDKTASCWLWVASKNRAGYGQIYGPGRPYLAHRVSWEIHNGPIPNGLGVLHRCDVPACVNPAHLFLGTPADNALDKVAKQRQPKGAESAMAKLSEQVVVALRVELSRPEVSQREIAGRYGVCQQTVSDIMRGRLWKHLGGPIQSARPYCAHGAKHHNAKLTAAKVHVIYRLWDWTYLTQSQIGALFSVTNYAVSDVVRGKVWRHLLPDREKPLVGVIRKQQSNLS